jgi:hypothetical protein
MAKYLKRLTLLTINANLRRFILYAVFSHIVAPRQRGVCPLLVTFSEISEVSITAAAKQHPSHGLTLNSLLCTSEKISPPATAGGGHHAKR